MNIAMNDVNRSASTLQSSQISVSEQQKKDKEEVVRQPEETTYDAISSQGDTLTISEAGKTALSNQDNQSESGQQASTEQQTSTESVALQNITIASSTDSESEEVSTVDLSGYTETELKQMYLDGDITKVEYDEEISSREV